VAEQWGKRTSVAPVQMRTTTAMQEHSGGGFIQWIKHRESLNYSFRAFGRRFYPKPLTQSTCVEGDSNITLVHKDKNRAGFMHS